MQCQGACIAAVITLGLLQREFQWQHLAELSGSVKERDTSKLDQQARMNICLHPKIGISPLFLEYQAPV